MINQNNNFLTYTTLKNIGSMSIPGPLQNSALRDYCKQHGYNFNIPIEEFIFEGCYIELFNLIEKLDNSYKGIITFSIYCLPKNKSVRDKFCKKIIKKNKIIHFINEKMILKNLKDLHDINDIIELNNNNIESLKIEKLLKNEYFNWR